MKTRIELLGYYLKILERNSTLCMDDETDRYTLAHELAEAELVKEYTKEIQQFFDEDPEH